MVNPDMHSLIEIFSQLSPEDEEALIALPYRAGLYVSHSDVTGGWDAQESEIQSLTGILRDYSMDFCKTEFSQKVLMDCLRDRTRWPGWSQDIDKVPNEAGAMVVRLKSMLSDKELLGFCEVITDIALAVAMAFREEQEEGGNRGGFSFPEMLSGLLGSKDPLAHANVSASEKTALKNLCKCMGYTRFA